jgi:prepilin-type N-terminal cleavage/methylation domain-containing protein
MATRSINARGFTLVELLITISIFSVTILMASIVVIGISRSYQKSTYIAQMSDSGRALQQDLYKSIAYQGGVTKGVKNGFNFICSGQNLYFWKTQTGDSLSDDIGLYKKIYSGATCSDSVPADPGSDSLVSNILPNGGTAGFVTRFDINPVRPGDDTCQFGCNVVITLKIGTPDMFVDNNVNNLCLDTLRGGEYCSEVSYNSFVRSKVGY